MCRLLQHPACRTIEHEFPCIHDDYAIADSRNGAQVVADIDHRSPGLSRQLTQQPKDMGLSCDVETGRRLIEQQNFGLARQRHRDGNTLLLTAREFVGIAFQHFLWLRQTHLRRQFDDTFTLLIFCEL